MREGGRVFREFILIVPHTLCLPPGEKNLDET